MIVTGGLKKRQDFAFVRMQGQKFVRPHLILQVALQPSPPPNNAKNEGQNEARLGYVVSRKCGNAVRRNRIKRRLRSAAARLFGDEGYKGKDFVIIGRAVAYDCDFGDLLQDLQIALQMESRAISKDKRQHHGDKEAKPKEAKR